MDGGETEIAHMVRASRLIQQDIPVGPPHRAVVEVVDHGTSVPLPIRPVLIAGRVEFLDAPLGKHQLLVGIGFMDLSDVLKHGISARPGFIPVESQPPGIVCRLGIVKDHVGPVIHQVAVVVPHDNVLIAKTFAFHGGPQVGLQEVALLLGGIYA